MDTLLVDQSTWDLVLDANGNIAVASGPYALAQDVASAARLFKGELWYDTTKGVPYFADFLAHAPAISLLKEELVAAALTVPDVKAATVVIDAVIDRNLTGQIQFVDKDGNAQSLSI